MRHLIEASYIPDSRSTGNLEWKLTFEANVGNSNH